LLEHDWESKRLAHAFATLAEKVLPELDRKHTPSVVHMLCMKEMHSLVEWKGVVLSRLHRSRNLHDADK